MIHLPQNFLHRSREKGTTLAELLVYIAILSVIMVTTTSLFASLTRSKATADAINIVNTNMRFAQTIIAKDLQSASSVTTPLLAGSSNNILTLVTASSTITFDVVSAQLRRTVGTGTPEIITTPNVLVSSPVFVRSGNTNPVLGKTTTTIQYGMTVSLNSTSPGQDFSSRSTTTIALPY